MTGRALRRYVEDLLHGRRPHSFAATDDDVATLQAAITLRAAGPGADGPRAEFVDALQQRLAAELDDAPPIRTAAWGLGRRGLLAGGAAVAAASAVVGVVVDRTLLTGRPSPSADTLTPVDAAWQTVAASEQLPEGAVRAFDLGAVVGFVARTDGVVAAVSGTCTHQGCRLTLNRAVPAARLPVPHDGIRDRRGAGRTPAPRAARAPAAHRHPRGRRRRAGLLGLDGQTGSVVGR